MIEKCQNWCQNKGKKKGSKRTWVRMKVAYSVTKLPVLALDLHPGSLEEKKFNGGISQPFFGGGLYHDLRQNDVETTNINFLGSTSFCRRFWYVSTKKWQEVIPPLSLNR